MAREIVDQRVDVKREREEAADEELRKAHDEGVEKGRKMARDEELRRAHDEGFEKGRKMAHSMAEILAVAAVVVPKFHAIRDAATCGDNAEASATLALAAVEHQKTLCMIGGMTMIAAAIERAGNK